MIMSLTHASPCIEQIPQSSSNVDKFFDWVFESQINGHPSPQLPRFSPALSGNRPVCSRASASLCRSGRASADWHNPGPRNAESQRSVEQTAGTKRAWPASCLGDEDFDWHCRLQRCAWVFPCHPTHSPHPTGGETMGKNQNEPEDCTTTTFSHISHLKYRNQNSFWLFNFFVLSNYTLIYYI